MASTPSGTVSLNVQMAVAIPAGTNVPTAYTIPVQVNQSLTYTAGTAANQVNKVATPSGSAAASPSSIDLTTIVCEDGTTGFSHVREIIIYNNDTTNPLTWDFTVANAFTGKFAAGGSTAKITVQPGAPERMPKPLGTNGYVVDSTHKVISLDPGANTIAWSAVIMGD